MAWGFVARRSQPHCRGMLPPRASPQAKWGATNVTGFALMTTKAETAKLLAAMKPGTIGLMARLLYGTGMRLMECVRLRVKDVLFEENQILVHDGKGAKDRVTMLPASVKAELETHLERVKLLHQSDLAAGAGEVYLPYALARKYPQAAREWGLCR